MTQINLLDYAIVRKARFVESNQIVLADPEDEVAIAGPVHICVRLQAANQTVDQNDQARELYHDVYTYNLMVPAGHTWRYHAAEALTGLRLGSNFGSRVIICPASPTTPPKPVRTASDLPCDFAVGDIKDSGQFFPAGCEPCPPAAKIALPPGTQPTLITPPASGGCVRTHYFNGMFITSEDLETDQRFFRLKNKLQNQTFGEGVVWGLDATCHGNSICVHPGYAIDCCGNSLVLTTTYKVDVDSLLRDPAGFPALVPGRTKTAESCDDDGVSAVDTMRGVRNLIGQNSRRMHLLLEYIECPEAPRPVHGDPCSPEVTDCEMSRIRESVRLRLVPPRDYDPRGCIDAFLAAVDRLKDQQGTAGIPEGFSKAAEAVPNVVPFSFEVDVVSADGNVFSHQLQPSTQQEVRFEQIVPNLPTTLHFRIRAAAGWSLTAGRVEDAAGNTLANFDPASPIVASFEIDAAPSDDVPATPPEFIVRDWCATFVQSTAPSASITASTEFSAGFVFVRRVAVAVQPTQPQAKGAGVGPYPCTGTACGVDPLGGLFNLLPPFLHADRRTGQAIDWKVLILAATYGWLVSEIARHKVGTPEEVTTQRLQAAAQVYLAALRLLCDEDLGPEASRRITEELRCLLQCWCKSFIYPGPECTEDPIGVVIGCVRIQGGTVRELDPLGGRRWVVTYPLLSHWGHQFGIAPLDVTLSRVFSLICCVSELPLPFETTRDRRLTRAGSAILLGTQARAEIDAELRTAGIRVERERTVDLDELVGNLVTGLRTVADPGARRFEVLTLEQNPAIRVAVPLEAAFVPAPDRVTEVARAVVPPQTLRTRVRPLLRPAATEVHATVLQQVPIPDLDEHPLASELRAAGIATSGDVLAREPEELEATLAAGDPERARQVSDLYQQSEQHAEIVGNAVVEAVAAVVEARDVVRREDLAEEESLAMFTDRLANRISRGRRILLPREVLESAVQNALAPSRRRRRLRRTR